MTFDWKEKNVFVTGADGFIASWVAKDLVKNGANVITLIRDDKPNSGIILQKIDDKVTQVFGDLTDYQLLNRVLNEYEVDSVFHLAAQTIVGIANNSPLSTFESNIRGTYNLLEACRTSKFVERVVVASSDKAYGKQEKLPYSEDSELLGRYPYDSSKACADILAQAYYTSYSLPVTITRNANTYGGGDMNFSRIVPDTIRNIILNSRPVIRSDGSPERDYIYVGDISAGYLRLGEKATEQGVKGQAFNFGSGKPVSVLELAQKILKLANSSLKPDIRGKGVPKNEIDRQYLSTEKAHSLLNWQPKYSLEQGLKETIEWYKNYFKNLQ